MKVCVLTYEGKRYLLGDLNGSSLLSMHRANFHIAEGIYDGYYVCNVPGLPEGECIYEVNEL